MTLVIFGAIFAMLGLGIVQDGLASIVFYLHKSGESWKINHSWRILRILVGLSLMGMGLTQIVIVLK